MTALPAPCREPARQRRNLPRDLYGAFDIHYSETGSVCFSVPQTIWRSAGSWIRESPFRWIAGFFLAVFVLVGDVTDPDIEARIFMAAGAFLVLRGILFVLLAGLAWLTEARFTRPLEIRDEGLTVDGAYFFERHHIHHWAWWRRGENYSFEIDYGVRKIVVLDDIDEAAAPLAARWFESTTRRVWAREN